MWASLLKTHSCHLIQEAKVQLETQDKREGGSSEHRVLHF